MSTISRLIYTNFKFFMSIFEDHRLEWADFIVGSSIGARPGTCTWTCMVPFENSKARQGFVLEGRHQVSHMAAGLFVQLDGVTFIWPDLQRLVSYCFARISLLYRLYLFNWAKLKQKSAIRTYIQTMASFAFHFCGPLGRHHLCLECTKHTHKNWI